MTPAALPPAPSPALLQSPPDRAVARAAYDSSAMLRVRWPGFELLWLALPERHSRPHRDCPRRWVNREERQLLAALRFWCYSTEIRAAFGNFALWLAAGAPRKVVAEGEVPPAEAPPARASLASFKVSFTRALPDTWPELCRQARAHYLKREPDRGRKRRLRINSVLAYIRHELTDYPETLRRFHAEPIPLDYEAWRGRVDTWLIDQLQHFYGEAAENVPSHL